MTRSPHISTPTAILLGSVIIAVGVFLGLRGRVEAPIPQAPSPTAAPAPPPLVPARQVDRDAVAKHVAAALAPLRKALTDECAPKGLSPRPGAPLFKCVFDFTFDAEGKQIMRGIAVDRESLRPEMTACVTSNLPLLSVPPPGQSVRVEVPFSLP